MHTAPVARDIGKNPDKNAVASVGRDESAIATWLLPGLGEGRWPRWDGSIRPMTAASNF
jgi:hypothetical protein